MNVFNITDCTLKNGCDGNFMLRIFYFQKICKKKEIRGRGMSERHTGMHEVYVKTCPRGP